MISTRNSKTVKTAVFLVGPGNYLFFAIRCVFGMDTTHPLALSGLGDFDQRAGNVRLSQLACCSSGTVQVRDGSPSGHREQARREILHHISHYPAAPNLQQALIIFAAAIAEAAPGAGSGCSVGKPLRSYR